MRIHWLCALPLSILLVGALQCWPNTRLVESLSPGALGHWRRLGNIGLTDVVPSLSVAPDLTRRYCLYALVVLLLMVLLISYCRGRFHILFTALAIALAVVVQALVAYYPFFFGEALFYWQVDIEPDILFGAFLNRNHFGFMLGMGALLILGLLFAAMHSRQRILAKSNNRAHKRFMMMIIPLVVAWFLVQVSQVFSLSRGAFMGTVPVALVLVSAWLFRPHGYMRSRQGGSRQNLVMAVGVVLCALFIALPEALPRLSERYERLMNDQIVTKDTRFVLWRESLPMLRDYWLCGIGMGNYAQVMTQYESDYTPMTLPINAHNDWLELMLEVGLPVALALYTLFALFLLMSFRRLRRQEDSILRWIGFGAFSALVMGMIHELVDYSLRAPANGLIYAALMVLVLVCSRSSSGAEASSRHRRDVEGGRAASFLPWSQRAVLLLAACLSVMALPAVYRRVVGSVLHVQMIEIIASQERAREKRYPLLKNEYKHLVGLSSRILELTPDVGEVLRRRAICLNHLAYLTWENDDESIVLANHYSGQARDAIRAACQRYPIDGRFHLARAVIYENAGWCARKYDEEAIANAFEQALAGYPRYAPVMQDVASAYVRSSRRLAYQPEQQALAVQHKERASALFQEYLRSVPWRAARVLADLWDLDPQPARLAALIPANFHAQRALYRFFMQKQLYQDALQPLSDVDALNRVELSERDIRRLSPYERQQYLTRSRDDTGLWIVGEQLVLYGVLGRWSEHAELWTRYRQEMAAKEARVLAKARGQGERGQVRLAEASLLNSARELPFAYDIRLALAEIYVSLGRWQDVATALSLFVYEQASIDSAKMIRALELMEQMVPIEKPGEFNKYRFVEAALKVRINEGSRTINKRQLVEGLKVFADLAAWNAANPDRAWIQRHLLDLYAGRAHELLGDAAAAAAAYRRGLEVSPRNLWLRQRLAALPAPHGEANELSAVVASLVPSRHYFGSDLCLLGYSFQPEEVQQLHSGVVVTHAWLCLDDINEDRLMLISFHNNGGRIFSDTYNFVKEDRPMVSWRIGELWLQERSYRPLLLAYQQGGVHKWQNGPVASEIAMRGMNRRQAKQYSASPRAYVPVFAFALQRD
ncbi:MAG: O-antigen ligase family protein [Lentisphaeria bacterium]|nr:O-antigen ligase family protein [Lentisphaeria bacterium]